MAGDPLSLCSSLSSSESEFACDIESYSASDGDELMYESDDDALLPYQGEPLASSGEEEGPANDADTDEDGLSAPQLAARYEGEISLEVW